MKKILFALISALLSATPSWAAYTSCAVAPNGVKRNPDGTVEKVVMRCTGAGETAVDIDYIPRALPSAEEAIAIRQARDRALARLNNQKDFAGLAALQPGQNIPAAPAPVVTPPTAQQVWTENAARLVRLRELQTILGASAPAGLSTEITTLTATVASGYQAGFGSGF